jgi:hypothetical protein
VHATDFILISDMLPRYEQFCIENSIGVLERRHLVGANVFIEFGAKFTDDKAITFVNGCILQAEYEKRVGEEAGGVSGISTYAFNSSFKRKWDIRAMRHADKDDARSRKLQRRFQQKRLESMQWQVQALAEGGVVREGFVVFMHVQIIELFAIVPSALLVWFLTSYLNTTVTELVIPQEVQPYPQYNPRTCIHSTTPAPVSTVQPPHLYPQYNPQPRLYLDSIQDIHNEGGLGSSYRFPYFYYSLYAFNQIYRLSSLCDMLSFYINTRSNNREFVYRSTYPRRALKMLQGCMIGTCLGAPPTPLLSITNSYIAFHPPSIPGVVIAYTLLVGIWLMLGAVLNPNQMLVYAAGASTFVTFLLGSWGAANNAQAVAKNRIRAQLEMLLGQLLESSPLAKANFDIQAASKMIIQGHLTAGMEKWDDKMSANAKKWAMQTGLPSLSADEVDRVVDGDWAPLLDLMSKKYEIHPVLARALVYSACGDTERMKEQLVELTRYAIHSSHTLLSYTGTHRQVCYTLLSYTPLMHSSHTLLSYTPLIHSSPIGCWTTTASTRT